MAYRMTGRKSGTLRFVPDSGTIEKETLSMSSKMTSNAIEDGSEINDHVQKNPEQLQIGGTLIGGKSETEVLRSMWAGRDLIAYEGRTRHENMVITSLQLDARKTNRTGCSFTATLQKAGIISSVYVPLDIQLMSSEDGAKSGQQAAVKNSGKSTTMNENISDSAYGKYVDAYNGKSSAGPVARKVKSYNGVSEK